MELGREKNKPGLQHEERLRTQSLPPISPSGSQQLLTCFSFAVHLRPVSVHVHGLDLDGVGGVWDQIVQVGVVGVPWNQDLHKQRRRRRRRSVKEKTHLHESSSSSSCSCQRSHVRVSGPPATKWWRVWDKQTRPSESPGHFRLIEGKIPLTSTESRRNDQMASR